jgi:hypothetical protein
MEEKAKKKQQQKKCVNDLLVSIIQQIGDHT